MNFSWTILFWGEREDSDWVTQYFRIHWSKIPGKKKIPLKIHKKMSTKNTISETNSEITCSMAVLVHFKLFEWALLVQIRSNILHQKCIFEANSTRDYELLQTVFRTKNGFPSYLSFLEKTYILEYSINRTSKNKWSVLVRVYTPNMLSNIFSCLNIWDKKSRNVN